MRFKLAGWLLVVSLGACGGQEDPPTVGVSAPDGTAVGGILDGLTREGAAGSEVLVDGGGQWLEEHELPAGESNPDDPKEGRAGWPGDDVEDCPAEPCGACDGKLTELTLRYEGDRRAGVVVVQKKDRLTVFDAVVGVGQELSFEGADRKGTLGTEILVYVDGVLHVRIHTSCSKPIGTGMRFGLFLVTAGASRDGGPLCEGGDDDDDSSSHGDDDSSSHGDDDSCSCDDDSRSRGDDDSRSHGDDDSRSHGDDDSRSHGDDDSRSHGDDDSSSRDDDSRSRGDDDSCSGRRHRRCGRRCR